LLRLLIEIYNGVPESFEVFQCNENSLEEDLKLFLSRASKFRWQLIIIIITIAMLLYVGKFLKTVNFKKRIETKGCKNLIAQTRWA